MAAVPVVALQPIVQAPVKAWLIVNGRARELRLAQPELDRIAKVYADVQNTLDLQADPNFFLWLDSQGGMGHTLQDPHTKALGNIRPLYSEDLQPEVRGEARSWVIEHLRDQQQIGPGEVPQMPSSIAPSAHRAFRSLQDSVDVIRQKLIAQMADQRAIENDPARPRAARDQAAIKAKAFLKQIQRLDEINWHMVGDARLAKQMGNSKAFDFLHADYASKLSVTRRIMQASSSGFARIFGKKAEPTELENYTHDVIALSLSGNEKADYLRKHKRPIREPSIEEHLVSVGLRFLNDEGRVLPGKDQARFEEALKDPLSPLGALVDFTNLP